jgi:PleD family two-component response regulator
MIRQDQKTIAILDDDPAVGRALRALLQSVGGHEVWPLEEPRGAYCPQELFDGVDLLLLLAVSGEERHKGLITAMRSTPQTSRIPVLVLSTGRKHAAGRGGRGRGIAVQHRRAGPQDRSCPLHLGEWHEAAGSRG